MNCQLCQKKSDAYRGGKLSGDMRTQVEAHLRLCAECAESYRLQELAENVINREKILSPDVYLTVRVMTKIENIEAADYKTTSHLIRVLKPALIMTSMAAAIFAGVLIGNISRPDGGMMSKPIELALIDDVAIESLDILSNE